MLNSIRPIQTQKDLLEKYNTRGLDGLNPQEQARLQRILPIVAKKLEGKSTITTAPLTDTERAAMNKYSNEELLQESIEQGYGLGLGKVKKQITRRKPKPKKQRTRTKPKKQRTRTKHKPKK